MPPQNEGRGLKLLKEHLEIHTSPPKHMYSSSYILELFYFIFPFLFCTFFPENMKNSTALRCQKWWLMVPKGLFTSFFQVQRQPRYAHVHTYLSLPTRLKGLHIHPAVHAPPHVQVVTGPSMCQMLLDTQCWTVSTITTNIHVP